MNEILALCQSMFPRTQTQSTLPFQVPHLKNQAGRSGRTLDKIIQPVPEFSNLAPFSLGNPRPGAGISSLCSWWFSSPTPNLRLQLLKPISVASGSSCVNPRQEEARRSQQIPEVSNHGNWPLSPDLEPALFFLEIHYALSLMLLGNVPCLLPNK